MRGVTRFNLEMSPSRSMAAAALACLLMSPAVSAQAKKVDFMADLVARGFFRGLVGGEAAALVPLCSRQVSFDGRLVKAPALHKELGKLVGRAKRKQLKLRRIVLLSYEDTVKRFGPPPARLKGAGGRGRVVALAAFQRGGAVLILAKEGRFWRVVALTD